MSNQTYWKVRNAAGNAPAEIELYGEITSGADYIRLWNPDAPERSATEFARALKALNGADVVLRINSPGGEVFQAQAMFSLLKNYKGHITGHIDGLCASAATLVASAADKLIMPVQALYMIHNPRLSYVENVGQEELKAAAGQLEAIRQTMINVYTAKCGEKATEDDIVRMLDDETWLTAQEAYDYGFVDEIDDYSVAASLTNGVVAINGCRMPSIRKNQQNIVDRINARRKKGEEKMDKANEILASIRDLLGMAKPGEAEQTAAKAAATAEQARIMALDKLKGTEQNPYVDAIVDVAKQGKTTAEELTAFVAAIKATKAPEGEALAAIKALITDQKESGAADVQPGTLDGADKAAQEAKVKQKDIDEVVAFANAIKG